MMSQKRTLLKARHMVTEVIRAKPVTPSATPGHREVIRTTVLAKASEEYKNYKALVERAIDVFGDEQIASRWLSTESVDFGGLVPLQVAERFHYSPLEVERQFEPVFLRIEHGIYA